MGSELKTSVAVGVALLMVLVVWVIGGMIALATLMGLFSVHDIPAPALLVASVVLNAIQFPTVYATSRWVLGQTELAIAVSWRIAGALTVLTVVATLMVVLGAAK